MPGNPFTNEQKLHTQLKFLHHQLCALLVDKLSTWWTSFLSICFKHFFKKKIQTFVIVRYFYSMADATFLKEILVSEKSIDFTFTIPFLLTWKPLLYIMILGWGFTVYQVNMCVHTIILLSRNYCDRALGFHRVHTLLGQTNLIKKPFLHSCG